MSSLAVCYDYNANIIFSKVFAVVASVYWPDVQKYISCIF